MRIVDVSKQRSMPIRNYDSVDTASVHVADGRGEAHVYCIHFEAGGRIGPHPTGFAQLFMVVQGSGWVAGADGTRHPIGPGEGAHFENDELHSKGSDQGMVALMIQVDAMELASQTDPAD